MADSDIQICFDAENQIRVLDVSKFKQMEALETECTAFTEKIHSFTSTVQTLVEVLDGQAKRIEFEKLRAIGISLSENLQKWMFSVVPGERLVLRLQKSVEKDSRTTNGASRTSTSV